MPHLVEVAVEPGEHLTHSLNLSGLGVLYTTYLSVWCITFQAWPVAERDDSLLVAETHCTIDIQSVYFFEPLTGGKHLLN